MMEPGDVWHWHTDPSVSQHHSVWRWQQNPERATQAMFNQLSYSHDDAPAIRHGHETDKDEALSQLLDIKVNASKKLPRCHSQTELWKQTNCDFNVKISPKIICCEELDASHLINTLSVLLFSMFSVFICWVKRRKLVCFHHVSPLSVVCLLSNHTESNTNRPKASSLAGSPGLSAAAKLQHNALVENLSITVPVLALCSLS